MPATPFIRCDVRELYVLESVLLRQRAWQWLQANHQDGTGRPFRDDVASSVNGRELRVAPRWYSLGRAGVLDKATGEPADMTCYVVKPDGSRESFRPYRAVDDAARRRIALNVDSGDSYSDRVAAFGATGVEYD